MPQQKPQIQVLIAERTLSVADQIAQSLSSEGFAITGIVTTCEQALEAATLIVPDIVLLEMSLPGHLDSLTTGQKIWEDLNCPVVYMATSAQSQAIGQAQVVSPYGCLVKPFTADVLKCTLKQALQDYWTQPRAVYQDSVSSVQDRLMPADRPAPKDELKQTFLGLLSAVSTIQPMPRVLFEGQVLKIYTGTLNSAFYLSHLCEQQAYAYQIFIWQWQTATFQLFDERTQNYTDSPELT